MQISPNQAILAAMAGVTDGVFCLKFLETGLVGKVTIGGYSIGKDMNTSALAALKRGRLEFVLPVKREAELISEELSLLSVNDRIILNLRINNSADTKDFAHQLSRITSLRPIIEVNAHCRQPEFLEKGGGEELLKRLTILDEIIKVLRAHDFPISLKIRGNTVNPREFSQIANKWNLDVFHIDSYRKGEENTDLNLLKEFVRHYEYKIIGNNSVIGYRSAKAILETGVDFFSLARAARQSENIFELIMKAY